MNYAFNSPLDNVTLCWPRLTTPFYSILFETSICQFNSSTFSSIMPDEVREHLTRYQRPFLHTEYLQILQMHSSMTVLLLFSSPHSFSTGFRSEDWNGQQKLGFVLSDPFLHNMGNMSIHPFVQQAPPNNMW